MSDAERKAEVLRRWEEIERRGQTAKLELSWKSGRLVAATKIEPLLK